MLWRKVRYLLQRKTESLAVCYCSIPPFDAAVNVRIARRFFTSFPISRPVDSCIFAVCSCRNSDAVFLLKSIEFFIMVTDANSICCHDIIQNVTRIDISTEWLNALCRALVMGLVNDVWTRYFTTPHLHPTHHVEHLIQWMMTIMMTWNLL